MSRTLEIVKQEFDLAALERNELQDKLVNEGADLLESEELAEKEAAVARLRAEYMAVTAKTRMENDVNNVILPLLKKHNINAQALHEALKANADYVSYFKIEVTKGKGKKTEGEEIDSGYTHKDIALSGKSKTWELVYSGDIGHPDQYLKEKVPFIYQVVGVEGEDGLWTGSPVPTKAVLDLIHMDRGEGKKPFMPKLELFNLLKQLKAGEPNPNVLNGKIILLKEPVSYDEVFKD